MKFFVTDGHLRAWREQIEREALARDRRKRDLEDEPGIPIMPVDPRAEFIAHLKAEVDYWRDQFQHERQRAEVAIDQCRATHQGIGPVSLPPRNQAPAHPAMADIFATPELAAMGLSDGVQQ